MLRPRFWPLLCLAAALACGTARGADTNGGQDLLDKATDTKLAAESVADLNEVVKLCEEAIKAGLDEGNSKFANGLLASTLTQRAQLMCIELFERPVPPARARRMVQLALADLEKTLKLDSEQAEAQFLSGRLYSSVGEPKKAMTALDEAVRLSDDDPPGKAKALVVRASLQEDEARRLADCDEAIKLEPRDPGALRFRGMLHLNANNLDKAEADLSAAVALEPKDPDTYEALGVAQALEKKYDEAMESFNKTIELEPDSPAALVHRARIRAIKGDAPAALRDVDQALKLQPGAVQGLQLRAGLLAGIGKYEPALADLNILRRAAPADPELLVQIAALEQAAKQPDKAVATYGQLLLAEPQSTAAHRGRADAYLSLGKQAEAIADYEAALKIEPNNSGVLNNLAWVLATSPTRHLRDGKRAIELAKQACELTEYKQAHILSTLAAGYAETGDFDTAITWSKKAVELGAEQLKAQLNKELQSYQAQTPWREAIPPSDEGQTAQPEKTAPASDDTARTKRGS